MLQVQVMLLNIKLLIAFQFRWHTIFIYKINADLPRLYVVCMSLVRRLYLVYTSSTDERCCSCCTDVLHTNTECHSDTEVPLFNIKVKLCAWCQSTKPLAHVLSTEHFLQMRSQYSMLVLPTLFCTELNAPIESRAWVLLMLSAYHMIDITNASKPFVIILWSEACKRVQPT